MVSESLTKEFQSALLEELGVQLEEKDAAKILSNLVGYFRLLMEIDKREVKAPHMPQN